MREIEETKTKKRMDKGYDTTGIKKERTNRKTGRKD